jgi:hypothetical protein
VISQQLQARKIEENVEEAIESLLNGYSLNNKGLQLYVALTGDAINQQKPLWDNYLRSVGRRNKVVHRGSSVDRAGAEESLQVATDFISHLKQL